MAEPMFTIVGPKQAGVGYSKGPRAQAHDQREFTPPNADKKLAHLNDHWALYPGLTDEEAFERIFAGDVAVYNESQIERGHPERQIDDYYAKLEAENEKADAKVAEYYAKHPHGVKGKRPPSGGRTLIEEAVISIGGRDDGFGVYKEVNFNGMGGAGQEKRVLNEDVIKKQKAAYRMVRDGWSKKFPHFQLLRFDMHFDEPDGAGHAHIAFVPVGEGFKKGMEHQCSFDRALKLDGFKKDKEYDAPTKFMRSVREYVADCAKKSGLEVTLQKQDEPQAHLPNGLYQKTMSELDEAKSELQQTKAELGNLERKRDAARLDYKGTLYITDKAKRDADEACAKREAEERRLKEVQTQKAQEQAELERLRAQNQRTRAQVDEDVEQYSRDEHARVDHEVEAYRTERMDDAYEMAEEHRRRKYAEVDKQVAQVREKHAAALGMNLEQVLDRWALPFMVKCLRGIGALARKQGLTMNGESIGELLDRAANALDGIQRSGEPHCMLVQMDAGKACGEAVRDAFASHAQMQRIERENARVGAMMDTGTQYDDGYSY